jgi:hypothetical protein
LAAAADLTPKSADLVAARARLSGQPANAGAGDTGSDNSNDTAAPTVSNLTPQQQAQVANMVQRAQIAAARGNIMSPPGDCAYDLYRGALSIDGNDPSALAGLQGLPGLVQQQFNQAVSSGNLNKAANLLDALDNLSPGDTSLLQSRQRLADAWIDQAEQQFDSGDRGNAATSLQQGMKLMPNDQRAQQLKARLQGGG